MKTTHRALTVVNCFDFVALAAAATLSRFASPSLGIPTTQPTRQRSIRLAHLTDLHVQPELAAGKGFAQCLQHVQSEADKPELILGGDSVMETMHHDADRTKLQWDLWQSVMKHENSINFRPILGNHDVWGWNKKKSNSTGSEPLWGKKYALDRLGLAKSYYSFDQAGWHFVMLDSIFSDGGNSYIGKLDDEQFAWLESDLAATPSTTPILVLSHIPIVTVTGYMPSDKIDTDGMKVGPGAMHSDFGRIRNLFRKHVNVKLCISGHTHLLDDVTYLGVRYCCNGAVSGDWWKGNHLGQCAEGYTMIDLFDDGSAELVYRNYGWIAEKPTTQPNESTRLFGSVVTSATA